MSNSNEIHYGEDQINKSKKISEQNMGIDPEVFELCGERFLIMPKVFSPELFPSAKIYYPKFPWEREENFLEIGYGAGYASVLAVKNGAKQVVATDISDVALENTKLNCRLHRVEDRVEIIKSDIFSQVIGKFSTIYWNHPFITAPEDYKFSNIVERAIFDPGYKLLYRFLDESRKYLAIDGRILVGLADVGGLDYFKELVNEFGFSEKEIISEVGVEGNKIEVKLYELRLK